MTKTATRSRDGRGIRWDGNRWEVDRKRSIDTSGSSRALPLRLKAPWADTAATRIRNGAGKFAYLVFTTDEDTLAASPSSRSATSASFAPSSASARRQTRLAGANLHLFPIDGAN